MATVAEPRVMAKRGAKDTMPIRLSIEAVEAVRIAAAHKGVSLAEYASDILLIAANRDIDEALSRRTAKSKAVKGRGAKE